jgi:transcriptional regulator with XRE-family HTH domain
MPSSLHSTNYLAFVAHLVDLRTRMGVTQTELAALLDKPQSFISKIERAERRMDPEEFRAIVSALGGDPGEEFASVGRFLETRR